ncbi:response regulator [Ornithinibacillus halotolerans]|uniref:DNA-binding response regulator n=1 Tax=Ornithinibacillus halotolerans TaxID=1274357 RepID=A0A916RQ95_9BACI|nr:response regulator transcription factor [Ornithinibacillus halotolerans]GGA65083.1 DNA-binding response regulator [Ornithinibacillus halotolerans]
MITVIVVDPTRLFREVVRSYLEREADVDVVGTADHAEEAIALIEEKQANVVLIEADMPKFGAIKAARIIKKVSPSTSVIYLTENKDLETIYRALANGADGYLLKDMYPDMLIQSIRNAARGEHVLSGEVAKIIVDQVRKDHLKVGDILARRLEMKGISLRHREKDVVGLLYKNYTNQQISKELHLSEGTIKNYISEIYVKLGINQRDKVIHYLHNLLQRN